MRAIIFDTETTDLISNSGLPLDKMPHTIELYACLLEKGDDDSWEQVDEIDLLFKPPYPITAEITKITSITDEMVKDCPKIGDRFDKIVEFFAQGDMVVAHNLTYDKQVLKNEAERLKRIIQLPVIEVCTVEVSEPLFGRRMNLNDLHEALFGERFESAHRAKNDVQATSRVFQQLWRMGEI